MLGVNGVLKVRSWLGFNFDGWFVATDGHGTMDDYDWQIPGYEWTDWSHHEGTDRIVFNLTGTFGLTDK